MQRTESDELVEKVYVVWRLEGSLQDRKRAKDAWWEFLHDLDLNDVRKALNARALTGGYPPKPGELRVAVLYGQPPLVAEAWGELQELTAKVNSGIMGQPLSPLTQKVLRRIGNSSSLTLHTNGDREFFTEVFNRVVQEEIAEACQLKPLP